MKDLTDRSATPPEHDPDRVEGLFGRIAPAAATARDAAEAEGAADAADRAAALIGAAEPGYRPDALAAAFLHLLQNDLCRAVRTTAPVADTGLHLGNLMRGSVDLGCVYGRDRDARDRAVGDPALRDPKRSQRMLLDAAAGADRLALPPEPDCLFAAAPLRAPSGEGAVPLLADARNMGDPLLERLVRAALRLHNQAAEELAEEGVPETDPMTPFLRAREEVRLLVHWLAVNAMAPTLAGAAAVERAVQDGAPLFSRLAERSSGGVPPLPLEAMISLIPMIVLHRGGDGPDAERLSGLMALEREFALPGGQAVHAAVAATAKLRTAPLTATEIADGPAAAALAGGLDERTPLILYLLREAEERGADEEQLGPLGQALLAQVVVGLMIKDPMSYWRRPGDHGRWRPEDGVLRVRGRPVETLELFLDAAEAD